MGISRSMAALTIVLGGALLTSLGGVSVSAAADSRNANSTFTKYISSWPEMAGVVGGDVGEGTYSGTILNYEPGDASTVIDATYRFHGSTHSFVANVHVVQTGLDAVITGLVTDGWLSGNQVRGQYRQITCNLSGSPTDCFQGSLDILRGTKR